MKTSNLIILLMTVFLIAATVAFGQNKGITQEQERIKEVYETVKSLEQNKLLKFAGIYKADDEKYVKIED